MITKVAEVVARSLVPVLVAGVCNSACTSDSVSSTYFIRDADAWKLKEAVNPAAGKPVAPERSLDWYAEYERFPTQNRSEVVRLSGHDASMIKRELGAGGFKLRAATVRGRPGLEGGDSDTYPAVVLFEPESGYAVMTLSYELDVNALIAWMGELRPATEEQWIDAGGKIVE